MSSAAILPDPELAPARSAFLFILDSAGLLFSEADGEFYRLDDAATLAWCRREEGLPWPAIAQQLADACQVARVDALSMLGRLSEACAARGVMGRRGASPPGPPIDPPAEPAPPQSAAAACSGEWSHCYRLLGTTVRVLCGDGELAGWIHPVLAHLEDTHQTQPQRTISVARSDQSIAVRDGAVELLSTRDPTELASCVKFAVLRHAVMAHDHLLHLHAAAVVCRGKLVVIPAASGSGKTSLAARLIFAGCEYFSDEVVLLDRLTGGARPAPVSLCVKESGLETLSAYFPHLSGLPALKRQDGASVRYLPPPDASLGTDRAAAPALLVFRRYVENARTRVRALPRTEAFMRLLENRVAVRGQRVRRLTLADAALLVRLMEGVQCFELTGGDLDEAARKIEQLCSQV